MKKNRGVKKRSYPKRKPKQWYRPGTGYVRTYVRKGPVYTPIGQKRERKRYLGPAALAALRKLLPGTVDVIMGPPVVPVTGGQKASTPHAVVALDQYPLTPESKKIIANYVTPPIIRDRPMHPAIRRKAAELFPKMYAMRGFYADKATRTRFKKALGPSYIVDGVNRRRMK